MQTVPVQQNPNQAFNITLGGQQVQLGIYQTNYGLFVDVALAGVAVVSGGIAENLNPIVRAPYTGFLGDLVFFDTTGAGTDPVYTGLGSQYQLIYLEAADLAAA